MLAHYCADDPKLIYANAAAFHLWEAHWSELIGLPSRLTATAQERDERRNALRQAQNLNAIQGYAGIRVSGQGRCFQIRNACIWTLWDDQQQVCGQAASFKDWWWI